MNFSVIWEHPEEDVLMEGNFDGRRIIGVLKREAVEDDCDPPQSGLSRSQCNRIAEANIEILSKHLHRQADGAMAMMGDSRIAPRVTIQTGDLRRQGTLLSPKILQLGDFWVDSQGNKPERD